MIAIDSDLLAIFHIFKKDPRFQITRQFFAKLTDHPKAVTIFNLLELCGIISTATGREDASKIFQEYTFSRDVIILFPNLQAKDEDDFWATLVSECFSRIQKGMRLGDAVILWTLETNEKIDSFITWNAKHFRDKTSIRVLTPSEFLE